MSHQSKENKIDEQTVMYSTPRSKLCDITDLLTVIRL